MNKLVLFKDADGMWRWHVKAGNNPLSGAFSPATRKALYTLFSLATLAVGAVMAYCGATEAHQPSWVDGANAVLVYVGLCLGLTAASNVPTPDTDEAGGEEGSVSLLEALGIAALAIVGMVIALLAFGPIPR